MLSKQASHALKALLLLAAEPQTWQSTPTLARAQDLPEPMLEQLLLRLRRAGLLVARRGRLGGYRLARATGQISLAAVLEALQEPDSAVSPISPNPEPSGPQPAAEQVTRALEQRLERARLRALQELTLEDLLFDLRSAEASLGREGGLLVG